MAAPLSNKQKFLLSDLSARAFRFLGAKARARGEAWPVENTAALTQFRHEHVQSAVQKNGLRCCTQDDWAGIKAHFQALLGQEDKALRTLVHGDDQKRREAEAVLFREMQAAGLHHNYVAAICRSQFKCSILEASGPQLWKLVYTVRNRAAQRRRASA